MRITPFLTTLLIFSLIYQNISAQELNDNIPNPVLPGVRDVGAFRYNGEYYLGGMNTNGGFYISKDMVNWKGPIHVFSMENDWTSGKSAGDSQIHAGDINYINGKFHFYWSVNYWGTAIPTVHVGHAASDDILGPYTEPNKTTWLTNRIDPHLFIDDDRQQYLYTVKFTDGNTIWGNHMINPKALSDDPRYLFASLPHTWETYDNRVAEGPWVIKYRDKYFMMYNANHTAPHYGNYALGAAMADHPLGFNNGNKYPFPLVESNQVYLEDNFIDLLHPFRSDGGMLYTIHKPGDNWFKPDFQDDEWNKGRAAFGNRTIENSATRKTITLWDSEDLWVRKSFYVNNRKNNHLLRIQHDGSAEVYLNGHIIYQAKSRDYTTWNFDEKAESYLQEGNNILAVHSHKNGGSNFLDFSVFDMKNVIGDDIMYVSGQPSIVKGTNGFEWWMIYFTMKNGGGPGQFINRVLFFDKQMYVDGPTAENSSGYHPLPAPATFADDFTSQKLVNMWKVDGGRWDLNDAELENTGEGKILIEQSSSNYLFEVNLKLKDSGYAGIYAYWKDQDNWLKILLDKSQGWTYELIENGNKSTSSYTLFDEFDYNAYHSLTINKNGSDFHIAIDHLPAPGQPVLRTNFTDRGQCGLYARRSAAFDGVVYTMGWDEFDKKITGWGPSDQGTKNSGEWRVSGQGLAQKIAKGIFQTFKGDLLKTYDFSLQIEKNDLNINGKAGAFPVYIDDNNFLLTKVDYERQCLIITGKRDGSVVVDTTISLNQRKALFANRGASDFSETHFKLQKPGIIDALEFYKRPHFKNDTIIENIPDLLKISYKNENKWVPLTQYTLVDDNHPGFTKINFSPIQTNEIRLEHRRDQDFVYKIFINQKVKTSYNLRIAKTSGHVVAMVDGKEFLRFKDYWRASRVGLMTENCAALFNGIMLYHLPEN